MEIDLSNYSFEKIKVIGIERTGITVLNQIVSLESSFEGLEFIIIDSDYQNLFTSQIKKKIHLKLDSNRQEIYKKEDEEELWLLDSQVDSIMDIISGCEAIFLVVNLGDKYGTEIISQISSLTKSLGYFTVGFFMLPFSFGRIERISKANKTLKKLTKNINAIFFPPNDHFYKVPFTQSYLLDSFNSRFDNLRYGLQEFLETVLRPAQFKDTHILFELTHRKIGTFFRGEGEGNNRALKAAENAIQNLFSFGFSFDQTEMFFVVINGSNNLKISEVNEILPCIMKSIPKDKRVFHSLNLDLTKKFDMVKVTIYVLLSERALLLFSH